MSNYFVPGTKQTKTPSSVEPTLHWDDKPSFPYIDKSRSEGSVLLSEAKRVAEWCGLELESQAVRSSRNSNYANWLQTSLATDFFLKTYLEPHVNSV